MYEAFFKNQIFKEFETSKEGSEWGWKHFADVLTPSESNSAYISVLFYMGSMARKWNKILRRNPPIENADFEDSVKSEFHDDGEQLNRIIEINSVLQNHDMPENMIVYRYTDKNIIKELCSSRILKKGMQFVDKGFISTTLVDESKRLKYQQKFLTDQKFRNQELEYILILIDRYINYEKTQMLAKTYLSYLKDEIDWITFCKYSEIIDRFLPEDKEYFLEEKASYRTVAFPMPDSFIRLSALGLYEEHITTTSVPTTLGAITIPAQQEKNYKLTEFGKKFQDILGG